MERYADPTPEEIRQACREIQATWSDVERHQRATRFADDFMWATREDLAPRSPIPCFAGDPLGGFVPLEVGYPER